MYSDIVAGHATKKTSSVSIPNKDANKYKNKSNASTGNALGTLNLCNSPSRTRPIRYRSLVSVSRTVIATEPKWPDDDTPYNCDVSDRLFARPEHLRTYERTDNSVCKTKCLSENQIQEAKSCSLKYINSVFDRKYAYFKDFYIGCLPYCQYGKGAEFMVVFFLMLSISEKNKNKCVLQIVTNELNMTGNIWSESIVMRDIISVVEQERRNLFKDDEESVQYLFKEYIDSLWHSTRYFNNKRRWNVGDNRLELLSKGVHARYSKDEKVRNKVEEKLNALYEKIRSSTEGDKMVAICNYAMEKVHHEIFHSSSRINNLGFTKDDWSIAANYERGVIFDYISERYALERNNKSRYKAEKFLGALGNCDHFSKNILHTIRDIISENKKYDYGYMMLSSNKKTHASHSCCYFQDRETDEIMIIDSWKNIYFNLKSHGSFLSEYLTENFLVKMVSFVWNDPLDREGIIVSKICREIQYRGNVFSEHLKTHYQRKLITHESESSNQCYG